LPQNGIPMPGTNLKILFIMKNLIARKNGCFTAIIEKRIITEDTGGI